MEQTGPGRNFHYGPAREDRGAGEVVDGGEDVGIQMEGKTIRLSAERLAELAQVMDVDDATSALLDHGVGHHTVCPWDFETHLKLYASLKPV